MWSINWIVLGALLLINLYAFALMGIDKRRAKKDKWRISEKRLLLTALCFGGIGALTGMKVFRHKTLHNRFRFGVPAMVILQLIVLIWLIIKQIY